MIIHTIGHSTRPLEEFISLLHENRVDCVVDVRAFPGSRTNPQYKQDNLIYSLPQHGLLYRHIRSLGGRRKAPGSNAPSPNGFWENRSFRNYADYAMTEDFATGLEELMELARGHHCAIMCSEAVWWRCHRRIIADYLLVNGIEVLHIMAAGKTVPAVRTESARLLDNGTLVYERAGHEHTDSTHL